MTKELRAARKAHDKASRAEEVAQARLMAAIGAALDAGMPVGALTWSSGLTRQRVYQIRRARELGKVNGAPRAADETERASSRVRIQPIRKETNL